HEFPPKGNANGKETLHHFPYHGPWASLSCCSHTTGSQTFKVFTRYNPFLVGANLTVFPWRSKRSAGFCIRLLISTGTTKSRAEARVGWSSTVNARAK